MKTKLSLTSFELIPLGNINITLKQRNETFSILQPEVNLHNYVVGTPYLWFKGDMVCTNNTTGDRAIINFKPKGWTSKGDFQCDGQIIDERGVKVFDLYGLWNEFLAAINPYSREEIVLAKRRPEAQQSSKQYNFSKFGINLNHLNQKMLEKIAPTDSRLRPDVRALENGNMDMAANEKARLESKQRERKKQAEQYGLHHSPKWFDYSMHGDQIMTRFKGEFFMVREKGVWPSDIPNLF